MKVEEIEVGKKYRFIDDLNHDNIMLGIGMRKLYTNNEFTEKHLVYIKNNDPTLIGRMIQEGDNAGENVWDRIVEEDSGTYIRKMICQ
jgi:hypothetical protein